MKSPAKNKKHIAFHLEGVIVTYNEETDDLEAPINGAIETIQLLQEAGNEIYIHTAGNLTTVQSWWNKYGKGIPVEIVNILPESINVLVSDGVYVYLPLDFEDPQAFANRLINFKPYWK